MSDQMLVTGGAGFIGSHLVERLLALGHTVRVLDDLSEGRRARLPAGVELIEGSVADPAICRRACQGIAGVFHLAAMSRVATSLERFEFCTEQNIIGTQNLLLAARDAGVRRFIFSGSSTYYGNGAPPQAETALPQCLNPYAVSKYVGEQFCEVFTRLYGLPTLTLRYFNVYGLRQPEVGAYALVLGIFLGQHRRGEALTVHGDGSQRRDFVHVSDVVAANLSAYASDLSGMALNIGSGSNLSIQEIADLISPFQVHLPRRAGDAEATLADIRARPGVAWMGAADGVPGRAAATDRRKVIMADFHLVIPAYREARRLPLFLRELTQVLGQAPFTTDILIVEDGSPPAEQRELIAEIPLGKQGGCQVLEPILLTRNEGKGAAIIRGWRAGETPAFTALSMPMALFLPWSSSDFSPTPSPVPRSRRPAGGPPRRPAPGRTVHWSRSRFVLSRTFAIIANSVLGTSGYDLQCGCKIVSAASYRQIAPWLTEARYCFDLELLLAIRHVSGEVVEVPIDWHDMPGGQLHPVRDGWAMISRLPALQQRARAWAKPMPKD